VNAVPELWVVRSGTVAYVPARESQKALEAARHAGEIPDVLLLLEHPPVYTKGRRTQEAELPMGEEWYVLQGIEVVDTDRGGRVTYHGPGQLVAYPIVSLKPYGDDVHAYVRRMEETMIGALGEWEVSAQVIEGLTGVWTDGDPPPGGEARKIGSIGIHINRGITTHGLAINVNNDLQPFEWIVPCGIEAVRITSLARELGAEQDLDAFASTLARRFGEIYGRRPIEVAIEDLLERVPSAAIEDFGSPGATESSNRADTASVP
jgi:lipoyl(octanoyl) transferase